MQSGWLWSGLHRAGPQWKQQQQPPLCGSQEGSNGTWEAGPVVRGCERHQEIMETADRYSAVSCLAGNSLCWNTGPTHTEVRKGRRDKRNPGPSVEKTQVRGMGHGPLDG